MVDPCLFLQSLGLSGVLHYSKLFVNFLIYLCSKACYVVLAGLELLGSRHLSAPASPVATVTGTCHSAWQIFKY